MCINTMKFQTSQPILSTMNSGSSKRCRKVIPQASSCDDESSVATEATGALTMSERSNISIDLRVRFAPYVTARFIPTLEQYTSAELAACWFQEEEYSKSRRECSKQIKKMNAGGVFKDKKYCSRGLESHTRTGSLTKNQNRRAAFEAVLLEQEDQRQFGVVDEKSIAQRYYDVSSSCQLWASCVGLQDQRATQC